MIRLCIIGNSHAAALKHAAAEVCARNPDIQLSFFAAKSNMTGDLAVQDGVYRPLTDALADQIALTSGGLRAIDPQDWDAYLVYGFSRRPHPKDFALGLSHGFRRAIFAERIAQCLLPQHLAALRSLGTAPIFAALTPMPAPTGTMRRRRLLRHHDEVAVAQETCGDPHGATLVPQPDSTILDGLFTRPEYSAGSAPLDTAQPAPKQPHDRGETRHMNAAYGKVWLTTFLPILRQALSKHPKQSA